MPIDFKGRCVACFESRRNQDIEHLITEAGGVPLMAPAMREVPLEHHTAAFEFARRLMDGRIDVVVMMTGVGVRLLFKVLASEYTAKMLVTGLQSIQTVAMGTKPLVALREFGLSPNLIIPEPHTWNDLLATLDRKLCVQGKCVAVQEYGQSNPDLIKGLEERGAQVVRVPLYRWDLPEDLKPMRRVIDAIISGTPTEVDFALFTSGVQVRHVFQVAQMDGTADRLRRAFRGICIGSVGPIATRAIRHEGLSVDFEPDRTNMIQLVREMARRGHDLLLKKRAALANGVNTNEWTRIDMIWQKDGNGRQPARDSVFLKACRREKTPYTPVWVMRQAGRYQREYLKVRKKVPMLTLCKTPELAAEVTLMAVDRLGVDAAIIFADILLVTEPMGLHLEFVKGEGPVIYNPVRTGRDVENLVHPDNSAFDYVFDAIRITRRALRPDIALIGFSGAPFTIASYMIEGGKSSHYVKTKSMMYQDEAAWHALMERLTRILIAYLNGQIRAGADAVQIFDSWVGALSPDDYRRYVMPHVKRLIAGIDRPAPVINFSTGNPMLLPLMKQAGGDVIGIDWRCDLARAWSILGNDVAVMGNMDPVVLYAGPEEIRTHVQQILDKADGRPGHIFNLGHGILPDMPPENVAEMVDAVHELSARG
ncbi:MAG: uroporphyrinogen decarboxylase [Deltaproteobacteria bacterium]|nr:uroporphyrinogen decarboxylase [Deltaproteobacteria bacterium]